MVTIEVPNPDKVNSIMIKEVIAKIVQPTAVLQSKFSYSQIIKSSALIGGSSMLNVGFGIIRTKAMALLLGPAGIGLLGLYSSICDVTRTFAGMGINTSGVRQIAEAVGSGDSRRIASTVITLRSVAFCTGALGALLLLAFSKFVSRLTFGDGLHTVSVAILAVAVFFYDISAGQSALVQGMRRISDLARMNVLGAFYGTVFSVLIVYFLGVRGVVLSLVSVAAMGILTSWWYARKIKVEPIRITLQQITQEASALFRLGVVFMASSLMTFGVGYLVRILVLHRMGIEAAGFYQAAWVLGGYYTTFILQAMGADFYPRLTAFAKENLECNRLVNEQVEVGLLAAGPGVLATLTLAPFVIELFYSAKFGPAVEILRWVCLGAMVRVVSWPLGFVLIAKGERILYFWAELLSNAGYVGLIWIGMQVRGLQGIGIAFFSLVAMNAIGIYLIVNRLSGFRWSKVNRQLGFLYALLITVDFIGWYLFPRWVVMVLGVSVTLFTGIYSLKKLCTLVPLERLPGTVQKIILFLRLAPLKTKE
jgi:PST family polysaccharide transporter